MITSKEMTGKSEPTIIKSWRVSNTQNTILYTLPHAMAWDYNLDQPTYILVTPTKEGILLKRLEVKK